MFDWVGKIFQAIIEIPTKIIEGLKELFKWAFYVDFQKVFEKVDLQEKLKSKFALFYDISKIFQDISVQEQDFNGIVTMKFPAFLGFENDLVVLDLNPIKPVLDWIKLFIKMSCYVSLFRWIMSLFKPQFVIN